LIVPPGRGVHTPEADGGTDAASLATYLVSLAIPVRVVAPDEVRHAVRARLAELLDAVD
jgi:hypothetical protein